ncbi:MAG: hypothetical protein WCD56_11745 [Pseudolabrys sp.]
MQFFSVTKLLIAAAVTVSSSALAQVQKISTCHAALVELATFDSTSTTFALQNVPSRNRSTV